MYVPKHCCPSCRREGLRGPVLKDDKIPGYGRCLCCGSIYPLHSLGAGDEQRYPPVVNGPRPRRLPPGSVRSLAYPSGRQIESDRISRRLPPNHKTPRHSQSLRRRYLGERPIRAVFDAKGYLRVGIRPIPTLREPPDWPVDAEWNDTHPWAPNNGLDTYPFGF